LRLEVAVNDPTRMERGDGIGDASRERQELLQCHRPSSGQLIEGSALEVLHHERGAAVVRVQRQRLQQAVKRAFRRERELVAQAPGLLGAARAREDLQDDGTPILRPNGSEEVGLSRGLQLLAEGVRRHVRSTR
jgi:hypothetical protein